MLNRSKAVIFWIVFGLSLVASVSGAGTPSTPVVSSGLAANCIVDSIKTTTEHPQYSAMIKKNPDGTSALWITVPGGAAPVNFGLIQTIPSGTHFVHWAGDDTLNKLLTDASNNGGKLPEADILAAIAYGATEDPSNVIVGGGLYVSTDMTDSIQFGNRAGTFTSGHDISAVNMNPIDHTYDLTSVVNAVSSQNLWIKENEQPTWINADLAEPIIGFHELTAAEGIAGVAQGAPAKILISLIKLDQRYPISLKDWPQNTLPQLRKLLEPSAATNTTPLSDSDKAAINSSLNAGVTDLLFFHAVINQFTPTPFFKAVDQIFASANGGTGLEATFVNMANQ